MDLKERIKLLVTEVICQLCTKEVPHKYQIQIEGTICISSDTHPPFAIQIAQLLSKAEADHVRTARHSFDGGPSSYGHGDGPNGPPSSSPSDGPFKPRHHSSPAEGPHYGEHGRGFHHHQQHRGAHDDYTPGEQVNDDVPTGGERDRADCTVSPKTSEYASVSPPSEIIHSTKRDNGDRAPLPQKKRRRYSTTQYDAMLVVTPASSQREPATPTGDEKERGEVGGDPMVCLLPTKKRESARKYVDDSSPCDLKIVHDLGGAIGASPANEQCTVKDMVRNLIFSRDKGVEKSQLLSDLSKSLSTGKVKLVIPSVSSPPCTPLPTPSAYDDHVFDLETPSHSSSVHISPASSQSSTHAVRVTCSSDNLRSPGEPSSGGVELTQLRSCGSFSSDVCHKVAGESSTQLSPGAPSSRTDDRSVRPARPNVLQLPPRIRKASSTASYEPMSPAPMSPYPTHAYHMMPIPDANRLDAADVEIKSEPMEYDSKSILGNLGHMSKEAINGLIIVDQDSQKTVSPQDYVYKDEVTGETLIKACDYCGKHFKYLSKLMEHIRSHTKSKPYKCSICGRTYTYKGDLTVHIRQHSLAKPYVCDCGRAFASKKYLSVHQSQARIKGRHAVSKDDRMGPMFECTQCGKRFKFFSSFDLHLQTHNLQTPGNDKDGNLELYECQACKCSFQDHVLFVEHVLEHEHGKFDSLVMEEAKESGQKLCHGSADRKAVSESADKLTAEASRTKPRCLSMSSISPDDERKRRGSERCSPMKTTPSHNSPDVGFFRPMSTDISFIGGGPPTPGQQIGSILLGNNAYLPVNQFSVNVSSATSAAALYPGAPALSASSPQMLMPVSLAHINQACVSASDPRRDAGHFSHMGPQHGPFSPRGLPMEAGKHSLPVPAPMPTGVLSVNARTTDELVKSETTPLAKDGKMIIPSQL